MAAVVALPGVPAGVVARGVAGVVAAAMIAESLSCYRCEGASTRGMLVEPHEQHQTHWVSGTARGGLAGRFADEGSGDRERYRVVAYRCTQCGALESFAVEPT